MTPIPRFDAIDHLHILVTDRPAAEAWYARVLGLRRIEALASWATPQGPLTLSDDANLLHLALFERSSGASTSTIALRVDSQAFADWRRHLTEQLPKAPHVVEHDGLAASMYFSDPDGNPFEITCYDMPALRAQGALV